MTLRSTTKAAITLILALVLSPAMALGQQQEELEKRLRALEAQVELLRRQLESRDTLMIEELRRQIEAITRELEEMRLGQEVVAEADTIMYGLGPGASKVYRVGQGVSLGGYGEMLYENFAAEREDGEDSGKTDQLDALRAVVYVGYKFNDRFLFNSEIEFEHGSTDQAGSVSLEFAYLDFRVSEGLGLRAGLVLLPLGFINELHEPPVFLGAKRPETERRIIPSTWRENGIGAFGEIGDLVFRAYLVNGLDAIGGGSSGAGGFDASGLRGGRQKGSKAVAESFAGAARFDYVNPYGLLLGTSAYAGKSGQGASSAETGEPIDAFTVVWDAHVEYRARGFDLRGLLALGWVDDAAAINTAKGFALGESVGERLIGWYLQGGYDVLRGAETSGRLLPYVRYEHVNTQDRVPAGYAAAPENDLEILTLGIAWKPITNLAVKVDYEFESNEAKTGVNRLNAAVGYLF
ncbi:MAG: hypothetical protein JSU87_02925 [Gemmatimonadota bacterium]|nr:MAG: hypothetical protein JSU87_02925 [Gemmatimonadota bacterium]